MRREEASLVIGCLADSVFDFVADLDNLPTWQPGITSAQQTSTGPVGAGATARVVRELMGQQVTVDIQVTDFVPGRRLGLSSDAAGMGISGTMSLEPDGTGTRVTVSTEIRARSPFLAPLEGMAAGIAREDMAAGLQRLKAALEKG